MKTRTLTLELDELDWDTIHAYIADFQACSAKISEMSGRPGAPTIVPDGESNLAGSIMAECVRDLIEYRAMADQDDPEALP